MNIAGNSEFRINGPTWETCGEKVSGLGHLPRREQLIEWARLKGFKCWFINETGDYGMIKICKL